MNSLLNLPWLVAYWHEGAKTRHHRAFLLRGSAVEFRDAMAASGWKAKLYREES